MPTFDSHANFAYSTVLTAPSPSTSGTTVILQAGNGAKFPAASFNATVWPAGSQPTTANAEIVRVTVIAVDTFTITRAQESSVARAIVAGDQFACTITKKTFTDIETLVPTLPVSVTNGGTGVATLAAHGVVLGNGTSVVAVSGAGLVNQVLASNGASADPTFQYRGVLDSSYTEQTVTNTTTPTSIYAYTIPANTLVAGRAIRFTLTGTNINTSGGGVNLTIALALGGTTLWAATLSIPDAMTNVGPNKLEAIINANNSSSSQRAHVLYQPSLTNLTNGSTAAVTDLYTGGHSAAAVDMTSTQSLAVTVTWASAASTITYKRWAAVTELL